MDFVGIVGLLASVLVGIQFLPQVIKTFRSKSAYDISLITAMIMTITAILWLIYGYYRDDIFILIANGMVLFSAVSLLIMKVGYKH